MSREGKGDKPLEVNREGNNLEKRGVDKRGLFDEVLLTPYTGKRKKLRNVLRIR